MFKFPDNMKLTSVLPADKTSNVNVTVIIGHSF